MYFDSHDESLFAMEPGDIAAQKGYLYYKRFLPHIDVPAILQFITYRLEDSIPATQLRLLEEELRKIPDSEVQKSRQHRIEQLLDQGLGSCVLRHKEAAHIAIDAWKHFDGKRYDLVSWVVMPTHVHVLMRTYPGYRHYKVTQSWKSYTGKKLLKVYPNARWNDKFWHSESFDRYIRDENHFYAVLAYITQNPVRAGLVKKRV